MNDNILVKSELSNAVQMYASISAEFDALEEMLSTINSNLNDTSLWNSDSRDTCAEIHSLIVKYVDAIKPIYDTLNQSITSLCADTDGFSGASRNVGKLW